MNKKAVKVTIGVIIEIIYILSSIYFIDKLINKYTEMVLEMPFAPKPKDLILICIMITISAIYLIRFINYKFIFASTNNKSFSEYEKYLLSELYGNSYVKNLEENNEKQKKGKKNNKIKNEDGESIENNEDITEEYNNGKNKDIIASMLNNSKGIKEYFEISKEQEKKSYNISIGCAIVGVAMLIVSIATILLNSRIETTIITIISGAITEVVSGIVLWIHNKSAAQLNYYYNALHENEKFLSAINLADKLGESERTQMFVEIIRAQIREKCEKEEK